MLAAGLAYPHFWTSRTIALPEPWYFIGRRFVDAAFTAPALLLTISLTATR
jgi:hypothetical protein